MTGSQLDQDSFTNPLATAHLVLDVLSRLSHGVKDTRSRPVHATPRTVHAPPAFTLVCRLDACLFNIGSMAATCRGGKREGRSTGRLKHPKQDAIDYHYFQQVGSKPYTSSHKARYTVYTVNYTTIQRHKEPIKSAGGDGGESTGDRSVCVYAAHAGSETRDGRVICSQERHINIRATPLQLRAPCSMRSRRDSVHRA